jgi:hypothetical protein
MNFLIDSNMSTVRKSHASKGLSFHALCIDEALPFPAPRGLWDGVKTGLRQPINS